eukprot:gene12696-26746_t
MFCSTIRHIKFVQTYRFTLNQFSKTTKAYTYLPKYNRLRDVSKTLKIPRQALLRELVLKSRGRFYCKFIDIWFEFRSMNDIIVPFEVVEQLINSRYKKHLLEKELTPILRDNFNSNKPSQNSKKLNSVHTVSNTSRSAKPSLPVVCILGHYNHGKTTILDAFAGTTIAPNEKHGITQEVRTRRILLHTTTTTTTTEFNIQSQSQPEIPVNAETLAVTLVDTPGQDIFFRMRNYGAAVADIVLLVIGLDEGICPQTEECIGILESL